MRRAHLRNAASTQKFFFRKHMAPPPENEVSEPTISTTSFVESSCTCGQKDVRTLAFVYHCSTCDYK
jgi:hypothetical protein